MNTNDEQECRRVLIDLIARKLHKLTPEDLRAAYMTFCGLADKHKAPPK